MNPLLIRRRGMMGAQGGYNTDPLGYISDGMALHFDAIANEGFNLPHNSSANEWKELIIGNSFKGFNGWGSDYAIFNGTTYMSFTSRSVVDALRNNTMTLEMMFLPTGHNSYNNNGYISIGSPERGFSFWDNPTYAISSYSYRSTSSYGLVYSRWTDSQRLTKITLNGQRLFLNGTLVNTTSNNGSITNNTVYIGYFQGFGRAKFYLYSLRIYNRLLTAAEMRWNSNVDNLRFQ